MMKKTYFLLAWLLAVAVHANNEKLVVYECNFNDGIPADYAMYDEDGQTPHFTMVQIGFDPGVAWISMREHGSEGNYYAASTSKHKVVNNTTLNAEDWLVTPAMRIPSADAKLTWRAQSVCEVSEQGDTYEIYVSTTGNRPEDFVGGKLMTVSGEGVNKWTTREAFLGEYAGKDVYIAFVNRSFLCEVLAIDDITVTSSPGFCEVIEEEYTYVYGQEKVRPYGILRSNSEEPITAFTAYCEVNGKELQCSYSGLSLAAGDTCCFEFDEAFALSYGDTLRYKTWVAVGERTTAKSQAKLVSLLFEPRQTTVFEEGTGMWCGYCPMGIVAMNRLKEKYPNEFIGIAIHYDDALSVSGYSEAMDFLGFPMAWVNRKYQTVPMVLVETADGMNYSMLHGGFETALLQQQAQKTIADVTATASFEGGQVHVNAQLHFAINNPTANYRMAYVVVEDRVEGEGFYQDNYFNGNPQYDLDGFGSEERRIIPFVFDDVARSIADHREGIPGSVPEAVVADGHYEHAYSFAVNNIDNPANAHVVAMLLDMDHGTVVNATKTAPLVTGIRQVMQGGNQSSAPVYDLTGRKVAQPTRGIYIVGGKKKIMR